LNLLGNTLIELIYILKIGTYKINKNKIFKLIKSIHLFLFAFYLGFENIFFTILLKNFDIKIIRKIMSPNNSN
jgi:hypothetical protein